MAITAQGMKQPDIDVFLRAVDDLADEMKVDRALMDASYVALLQKLDIDTGVTDTDYEAVLTQGGTGAGWPATLTAAALDDSVFTSIDMSQEDMVTFIAAATTLINEIDTDRATERLSWRALLVKLDADGTVNSTDYNSKFGSTGTSEPWPTDPAATTIVSSTIAAQGVGQPELYVILNAIETLANELRTDRVTSGNSYDAVMSHLDVDTGVTDTDYAAVLAKSGSGDAWPDDPSSSALDLSA